MQKHGSDSCLTVNRVYHFTHRSHVAHADYMLGSVAHHNPKYIANVPVKADANLRDFKYTLILVFRGTVWFTLVSNYIGSLSPQ